MLSTLILVLTQAPVQEPELPPKPSPELQAAVDRIAPVVARLRQLPFKYDVPVGVKTGKEFMEYATEAMAEEMSAEEMEHSEQMAVLLGLIEPGTPLWDAVEKLLEGSVGGYYDYRHTKSFYMIDTYNQGVMADVIMAHELCHALEDQYYEMGGMMEASKTDSDRQFALGALIEGSATALMNVYSVAELPRTLKEMSPEERRAMTDDSDAMAQMMKAVEGAPPVLVVMLNLPYIEGSKFISRAPMGLGAPSAENWDRAWREPPTSSEQILHPEKYWDAEYRDDPVTVLLPDLAPALGAGWRLANDDVLGELNFALMLMESLPPVDDIQALLSTSFITDGSAGWGGDRMHLYHGPDGAQLLLSVSVWDTPEDREEFLDDLLGFHAERNPHYRTAWAGESASAARAAVVVFANDAGAAQAKPLREAVLKAHPEWR